MLLTRNGSIALAGMPLTSVGPVLHLLPTEVRVSFHSMPWFSAEPTAVSQKELNPNGTHTEPKGNNTVSSQYLPRSNTLSAPWSCRVSQALSRSRAGVPLATQGGSPVGESLRARDPDSRRDAGPTIWWIQRPGQSSVFCLPAGRQGPEGVVPSVLLQPIESGLARCDVGNAVLSVHEGGRWRRRCPTRSRKIGGINEGIRRRICGPRQDYVSALAPRGEHRKRSSARNADCIATARRIRVYQQTSSVAGGRAG